MTRELVSIENAWALFASSLPPGWSAIGVTYHGETSGTPWIAIVGNDQRDVVLEGTGTGPLDAMAAIAGEVGVAPLRSMSTHFESVERAWQSFRPIGPRWILAGITFSVVGRWQAYVMDSGTWAAGPTATGESPAEAVLGLMEILKAQLSSAQ